jgi:hypothetical protein
MDGAVWFGRRWWEGEGAVGGHCVGDIVVAKIEQFGDSVVRRHLERFQVQIFHFEEADCIPVLNAVCTT